MEIRTWSDFGILTEEERSAYAPEELEALKTSIKENEAKLAEDRKKLDNEAAKAKELAENYKIRAEKAESKNKGAKSDEELLKRFNNIARKTAGIVGAEEVEFFEKWKKDNGYENIDDDEVVIGKKGFQTEFADFRTTKTNAAATTDIKGDGSVSGAKSDPNYFIAKATKGEDGKLRFPEEMPKELYSQIVAKLGEKEPGASKGKLEFYNR